MTAEWMVTCEACQWTGKPMELAECPLWWDGCPCHWNCPACGHATVDWAIV